jgi:hypothetical protein
MSEMNTIKIGPFQYRIIKVDGRRILLSWIETTGVEKQRWIILKQEKAA